MKVVFLADCLGQEDRHDVVNEAQYLHYLPLTIALVKTPHAPLLGPTLLSTIIRNAGYDVTLLQSAFRLPQRTNLLKLLAAGPDVICLSTTFIVDYSTLERCTTLLRKHCPKAVLILGGPSLQACPQMKDLGDYCVLGEGENVIVPLLEAVQAGHRDVSLPGVSYRRPDGTRQETPQALNPNLDSIPFTDWSLARRYNDEFFGLSTQRGCAWRCAFCNYPAVEGYQLRFRSVDSVLAEIRLNFEKHGIYRYFFCDSTFTAPPDRCLELLRAIARLPFKIEWAAYARVDTISPELVQAMLQSGCIALFFGVESGDEGILGKMKKRFTLQQVETAVNLVKGTRIKLTASWIIGWPGETPETIKRTVDFACTLRCDQNSVHTFCVSHLSPADLRPSVFGLEAPSQPGHPWRKHSTLTARQAERWTHWAILSMLARGLSIGSLFDFFWLASSKMSTENVINIFQDAQTHFLKSKRLHNHLLPDVRARLDGSGNLEAPLKQRCLDLSELAEHHPIYGDY